MAGLAAIFHDYAGAYLDSYGERILPSHRRALNDILHCRTQACGGRVFECPECGYVHYAYFSCSNRSCPQCQASDTQDWLDRKRKELLPVTYFHLVFTLPGELHEIARSHQKELYGLLMQAAADSVMKLAMDPHYLGGMIGILSVLHTWTRAMAYHPHVHCLIPGGALSKDELCWIPSRKAFLVPVRALSILFRATFMELARKALPEINLPQSVWSKDWVVYCKPSARGTEKVLSYLGRYVYRAAISNSRILSVDEGKVTFRYKDSKEGCWKTMTLPVMEFIRRFLQHVLPKGFHKVRSYGILAPANRQLLALAKSLIPEEPIKPEEERSHEGTSSKVLYCPRCKTAILIQIGCIVPLGRSPP